MQEIASEERSVGAGKEKKELNRKIFQRQID